MGLGIEQINNMEEWSIPLMSTLNDPDWIDNSWMVEHLRQLADKIEQEKPRIYSISLTLDVNYKCPNLILKSFTNI